VINIQILFPYFRYIFLNNILSKIILNVIYLLIIKKMLIRNLKTPICQFSRPIIKHNYGTHLVKDGKQKLVGGWLFITAAGVLGMIVLGGYTRLTHSGLSMVDWKPYTKKYPSNDE
jgi:hypothetical protein